VKITEAARINIEMEVFILIDLLFNN